MSMERPNLVLITGASGCVGAMVLDELLKQNYKVRATCRAPKIEGLKNTHPGYEQLLEIVEIKDLVGVDWTPILQDVEAVLHVAAPLFHPGVTSKDIYSGAVIGTRELLEAAGNSSTVKKFVLTGSIASFFKPDLSNIFDNICFDQNTWREIETLDPEEHEPSYTYMASKVICDKDVWKAAEKCPNLDFTTILLPCIYGKYLDTYPRPKTPSELNGNKFIYELFQPSVKFPQWPVTTFAHNRDSAKAHVRALTAPRLPRGEKKRITICGGTMNWVQIINYLKDARPAIADRLPDISLAGPHSQFKLDTTLAETLLGMRPENYIAWKPLILEVIDWLMDFEKYADSLV